MINPFKYGDKDVDNSIEESVGILNLKNNCESFIINTLMLFNSPKNEWWIEDIKSEMKVNFVEALVKLTFYVATFTEDVVTFNRFIEMDKNDILELTNSCMSSIRYILASDTFVESPTNKDMYDIEILYSGLIDEMTLFEDFSENRDALLYFMDNGYINNESSTSEYLYAVEKSLGISEFPIFFKNQIYTATETYYIIKYCFRVFKANYEEIKTREAKVNKIFKMKDDELLELVLKFPKDKLVTVIKKGIMEHFSASELYSFLRDFDNLLPEVNEK